MTLDDQIVVITGASEGFGKELARQLNDHGAKVIISSHDKQKLETCKNELKVDAFISDVTSFLEVQKLADYVISKYSHIDIWINNAGIQIAPTYIEDIDIEKLDKLFSVNVYGYFYGIKSVLPLMKAQKRGTIININSTAGLAGKPSLSVYGSSKFAVKGLTESVREELKGTGVEIFGVFPGGMQTDIYQEKVPPDFNDYMDVDYVVNKVIQNLLQEVPEIDLVIPRPTK